MNPSLSSTLGKWPPWVRRQSRGSFEMELMCLVDITAELLPGKCWVSVSAGFDAGTHWNITVNGECPQTTSAHEQLHLSPPLPKMSLAFWRLPQGLTNHKLAFLSSSLNSTLWITAPSQPGPFCSLSPRKRLCLQICVSSKDSGPNHLALTHQAFLVSGYAHFQAFYETFNKSGYPSRRRWSWKKVHMSQETLVFPASVTSPLCTHLELGPGKCT